MTVLRTWQFLEITVLIFTITGCEGSPSSPSAGPHDIDLVGFSVTSMGNFAGFGPYYTVCGAITKSTDVTDEVVLHDLTTSIRDAGGLEILRWSDGGIFTRLGLAGGGLSGLLHQSVRSLSHPCGRLVIRCPRDLLPRDRPFPRRGSIRARGGTTAACLT